MGEVVDDGAGDEHQDQTPEDGEGGGSIERCQGTQAAEDLGPEMAQDQHAEQDDHRRDSTSTTVGGPADGDILNGATVHEWHQWPRRDGGKFDQQVGHERHHTQPFEPGAFGS